jgi:hypothetical protein
VSCQSHCHADTCFSGDVGGQKTLRTYWKNYFEKTDTLIWVVDSTDRERLADCRQELEGLLVQEVRSPEYTHVHLLTNLPASHGCLAAGLQEQKRRSRLYDRGRNPRGVSFPILRARRVGSTRIGLIRDITGIALRQHSHAQMADHDVQRHDRRKPPGRPAMGRPRRQRSPLLVLSNLSSLSLLGASSSRR